MGRQVIPDNPNDQLRFFEAHIEAWEQHASAIGLDAEGVARIRAAIEAARAKRLAFDEMRNAAQAAALDWELASEELRRLGGNAVLTIKAHARGSGDNQVLIDALIDPPGRPGPKRRSSQDQAAAIPHIRNTTARPTTFGGIVLHWDCPRAPQGTFYRIHRQLAGERAPRIIAAIGAPGAGKRSLEWEDTDVPTGQHQIRYFITPCRGGVEGHPGPFITVQFGTSTPSPIPARAA